jgi:hypothetical protein
MVQGEDLKLFNGDSHHGFVMIQYHVYLDPDLSSFLNENKESSDVSNKDVLGSMLPDIFPKYLSGVRTSFSNSNFQLVEELNYTKYKIDDYPAASVVYSFNMPDKSFDGAGLVVFALINNRYMSVSYVADQTNFDSVLPITETIINSIKILDD